MTKSVWKASAETTKFSREVERINEMIKNDTYLAYTSDFYNKNNTYIFKYCVKYYSVYIQFDEVYCIYVISNEYNCKLQFSELGAETYVHSDGRKFTRIIAYNDKHKTVGSIDVPERRD